MSDQANSNMALPDAILKACGIDPNTVESFDLHCNASGAHVLTTRRLVWNIDPADVETITEHWQPTKADE